MAVDQNGLGAGGADVDAQVNLLFLLQRTVYVHFNFSGVIDGFVKITGVGGKIGIIRKRQSQRRVTVNLFPVFLHKKVVPVLCGKRCRICLFHVKQSGTDRAIKMAVFSNDGLGMEEVAEMFDHGGVHGDATGQNQRRMNVRIGNQGVDNVFGQTFAKTVADLSYGITFLLGVNQIGFCKDCTTRGDLRCIDLIAKRNGTECFDAFEVEPFRLLIQKAAGAGSTG